MIESWLRQESCDISSVMIYIFIMFEILQVKQMTTSKIDLKQVRVNTHSRKLMVSRQMTYNGKKAVATRQVSTMYKTTGDRQKSCTTQEYKTQKLKQVYDDVAIYFRHPGWKTTRTRIKSHASFQDYSDQNGTSTDKRFAQFWWTHIFQTRRTNTLQCLWLRIITGSNKLWQCKQTPTTRGETMSVEQHSLANHEK